MTVMEEKRQFLEKSLASARDEAEKIREVHLRAEVLAVISSVSDDMKDYRAANDTICQIPTGEFKSMALAAIAKRLAKNGKFRQAREIVHTIGHSDYYWRAEAIARIALYSRQASDFGEAKKYAGWINNEDQAIAVYDEIRQFEFEPETVHGKISGDALEGHVEDLVAALVNINDFDGAHSVAANYNSAYLSAHAFAIMANILAESIRQ